MARKAFSFHSDFYEEVKALDAESSQALMLALIAWSADGELPALDPVCAVLFRRMTRQAGTRAGK